MSKERGDDRTSRDSEGREVSKESGDGPAKMPNNGEDVDRLSQILQALKKVDLKVTELGPTHCRVCGTEVEPDARFCPLCGTRFEADGMVKGEAAVMDLALDKGETRCPSCSEHLDEGFHMCPTCGFDLDEGVGPEPLPSGWELVKKVDKRVVEEGGGEEIEVEPAEDVSEEPVIPPSTEPSIRPEEMDTISPTEGPVIEPADEASLTTPEGTASVQEMTVIEHDVGPPRSAEVPDDTGPEAVEVEYDEGAETGPEAVEVEYDEGADTGPDDITRPQDAVLVETGPPVLEMGPVDEPLKNGRLISTLTSEEVDPQHRGNGKRGLLSSKGLVNGSSLVNGNGMVNGRGLVNGKGTPRMGDAERPTDDHHPTRKPRKRSRLLKIGATVVIVGLMLMMGPLIAFRFLDEGAPGMVVDGDLSDWSGVLFYEDGMDVSIPNRDLDIVRYSATFDGKDMWFYARVDGDMLSGRSTPEGVDSFNIYIDVDRRGETGYSVGGIGADHMLRVHGYNGMRSGASLFKFDDSRGEHDWNGWEGSGGVSAIAKGDILEASVPKASLGLEKGSRPLVLFQIMDTHGDMGDMSDAIVTPGEATLVIDQKARCDDVVPAGTLGAPFLEVRVGARGDDIELGSITLTKGGDAGDGDVGTVTLRWGSIVLDSKGFHSGSKELTMASSLSLPPSKDLTLEVTVDVPVGVMERSLGLSIAEPGDVEASGAYVTFISSPTLKRAYLGSAPSSIVIDGAFGDWARVSSNKDGTGDVDNPNIDLVDYRTYKDPDTVSFFAMVDGTMLGGALTPMAEIARPGPPGPSGPPGPVVPLPVSEAQDTIKVLIDSDDVPITGEPVIGLGFGADHALVVSGMDGRITFSGLYEWEGRWTFRRGFDVAKDEARIEMQVALDQMGLNGTARFGVYFVLEDWSDEAERADDVLELIDPLLLTSDGEVNSSSDGSTWDSETDIGTSTFVDMTVNTNNGTVYVMNNTGAVFMSTGNWKSWTKVVNATTDTNFIALAVDSAATQSFFALQVDGETFNTTTDTWYLATDIGGKDEYADMCYAHGTGAAATLYAVKGITGDKVKVSTDGAVTWGNFGNKNVGSDAGDPAGLTNVGIINGSAWGGNYVFVLQSDGDIRYDSTGSTSSPWPKITRPAVDTYSDIAYESDGDIWVTTTQGQVYNFTPSPGAGNGNWTTKGNATQTLVVAIAVNEIPEFEEMSLVLIGTIAVMVVLQRRRGRRRAGRR